MLSHPQEGVCLDLFSSGALEGVGISRSLGSACVECFVILGLGELLELLKGASSGSGQHRVGQQRHQRGVRITSLVLDWQRCVWDGELHLHSDMCLLSGHICKRVWLGAERTHARTWALNIKLVLSSNLCVCLSIEIRTHDTKAGFSLTVYLSAEYGLGKTDVSRAAVGGARDEDT